MSSPTRQPDLSAVVLPDVEDPAGFLATLRAVEDAGLRGAWTYDHLSWRHLRDGPWHAAVPLLAAAAVTTSRLRLGTLVASPNYRHPVPFAKEVMTLDRLCGGRFDLGVGAGGVGADATVLGAPAWPPAERAARFGEWTGLLDVLLRDGATTARGERYAAADARMLPGCLQRPRVPFTVAAAGPRAMDVVARLGQAWVTFGPVGEPVVGDAWWAEVAGQGALLDAALARAGRGAGEVRRLVLLGLEAGWAYDDYPAFLDRARSARVDEVVVHWPRPDGGGVPGAALAGVLRAHATSAADRS